MRESRAICLVCRVRLSSQSTQSTAAAAAAAAAAALRGSRYQSRGGPWQPTAALSTRRTASTIPDHRDIGGDRRSSDNGSVSESIAYEPESARRRLTTNFSAVQAARRRRSRQPDDGALAVFRDVVEEQREQLEEQKQGSDNVQLREDHHQQLSPSGRSLSAGPELYRQLVKLTQLRSEPGVSVAELYSFFDSQMYPQMAHSPRDLPNIFKQAARQLVRDVSEAKQQNYLAPELPSVARITQVRRQLDLLNIPKPWVPLMLGLIEEILAGSSGGGASSSSPAAAAEQQKSAQLDDLVRAWRIFSLPDIVVTDEEAMSEAPTYSFRLPTPDAMLLTKYAWQRNLHLALSMLFPRYAPRQLKPMVPVVLATYALLTDPDVMGKTGAAAAEKAQEFQEAVGSVLAAVQVDRTTVADMFIARPSLGAYVLGRWPLVAQDKRSSSGKEQDQSHTGFPSNANMGAVARSRRSSSLLPRSSSSPSLSSSLDIIHKQLGQALRLRNLDACEAAWDLFWSLVTQPDADGAERLRESAEMFDYFIMVYTTMRQPERAIAIWNLMTLTGLKPTLRTWTSFMEGCKRASNPMGIRNIWDKLTASGMQMDTAVWTARISGLIQAGEAEAGIRALEEMQQVWEEAEAAAARESETGTKTQTQTITAVKPTIEPVNAAIAGLLRRGDLGAARHILGWAGQHGIAPDLITFNTILRSLVREGSGDEVAGLLEMMGRQGIELDETTVTVLLEGALGKGGVGGGGGESKKRQSKGERSSEELEETVRWMLAAVEAAGLDANQQTYAKLVYLLLQEGGSDGRQADASVEVVLAQMDARGLPLSSHICTILVDNYFSRQPPDLEAVQTLIETGRPQRMMGDGEREGAHLEGRRDGRPADRRHGQHHSHSRRHHRRHAPHFDRVFWERVVSGFAKVDDTASAKQYFEQIADSLSVTTSTLEDLLQALVRSADWDAAAQLVAKVQAQKMLLVKGGEAARASDARLFRHRFWHLAAKHGLLR